jgi:hypothetical protein
MISADSTNKTSTRIFTMRVLGRTLEHLGVQMYKRRDVAIAELVANCWDAGAQLVHVSVNDGVGANSYIAITDDGCGMTDDQVQAEYLVLGRNRRESQDIGGAGRRVMGRKGIGKLAGFGIASRMTVESWRDGSVTTLALDLGSLKTNAGEAAQIEIPGVVASVDGERTPTGTTITLTGLKHKTPLNVDGLKQALGRRFSRTVLGEMEIFVNTELVTEPQLDWHVRFPSDPGSLLEEEVADAKGVRYFYGVTNSVIQTSEMRGFTVYVRGKTAQAPPYFFDVEGTHGTHGTRYVSGAIHADFLDEGVDDDSDLVSTDRQEIDWEDAAAVQLHAWGQALGRKALRQWLETRAAVVETNILADPDLRGRLERLGGPTQQQALRLVKQLGGSDASHEETLQLADGIVRAFEYRHFHDFIKSLEDVSDDPFKLAELVTRLVDWKVMESRAILEVIQGRLDIITKFHTMIVNNAPETAPQIGADNMHDLVAEFPWLLNPEFQVLAEEKTISAQLKEWNSQDVSAEEKDRYDFLALTDDRRLVIVEIKRANHPVSYEELQRLDSYREKLQKARVDPIHMMLISGEEPAVSQRGLKAFQDRDDFELRKWSEILVRARTYYEHYRAVLESEINSPDFQGKETELAQTRKMLDVGVYRGKVRRSAGLGNQDVSYQAPLPMNRPAPSSN